MNQYMAGLITSFLELGLETQLLDILVQTFKVLLSNMGIAYWLVLILRTYIAPRFIFLPGYGLSPQQYFVTSLAVSKPVLE